MISIMSNANAAQGRGHLPPDRMNALINMPQTSEDGDVASLVLDDS